MVTKIALLTLRSKHSGEKQSHAYDGMKIASRPTTALLSLRSKGSGEKQSIAYGGMKNPFRPTS